MCVCSDLGDLGLVNPRNHGFSRGLTPWSTATKYNEPSASPVPCIPTMPQAVVSLVASPEVLEKFLPQGIEASTCRMFV